MSYNWSDQQLAIFEELANPTNPHLCIKATAGSSKTTSLTEAVARYKHTHPEAVVRYIVFGSLAAKEARREFSTNAIVSTLHAYAHANIVKAYNLGEVKSFLIWKDIPKSVRRPFGKDMEILQIVDDYCMSKYLSLDAYVSELDDDSFQYNLIPAVKQVLNLMATGKMAITHSFYLKLFHILVMRGTIKLEPVDRLLIDETQDLSEIALDIIEAIPATQKVLVGDPNQRIFSFMGLVDGFARFPNAKILNLSQSFRVDKSYAPAIQKFLRTHLEPDAVFEGMSYPADVKPVTKAYLTRTNAALISKMIELNKSGTPYHLSHNTKIKQMFKLPLALIYAKPGHIQRDPELRHLQELIDEYGTLSDKLKSEKSLYGYLMNLPQIDGATVAAIKLVMKYKDSVEDIITAYEQAEEHKNTPCTLKLMTAHTSKGSTRDIVELDDDLNKAIREALSPTFKGDKHSEFCLYFVAISRHKHQLIGADYLDELTIKGN